MMEYPLKKKKHWQRGDLNLRRRYQSTALLSTRPSSFPRLLTETGDAGSSPQVANEFFFR